MIGRFIDGAMDLAWTIEYAVQDGRARVVSIKLLFPLTGLAATESGIDDRVFRVITIISPSIFTVSGLAVTVSVFGSAKFT